MRSMLRKCQACGIYTMKDICTCGNRTSVPTPPRFSPQDRFGHYRRSLKRMERTEEDQL